MNRIFLAYVLAPFLLQAGCSTNTPNGTRTQPAGTDSTLPPVETGKPNAAFTPAFPGQTRIAGVRTSTPYQSAVISNDLDRPWGIASLPDGRLLITQKEGTMVIATTDGRLGDDITGLP